MPVHTKVKGVKRRRTHYIDKDDVELLEKCIEDLSNAEHQDVNVRAVKILLKDIHSKIICSAKSNSVVWILKFVSSVHLRALVNKKDAIQDAILKYLQDTQELNEYDFTEAEVDVEFSQEVMLECENNLQYSKI